jgi:hypothetical protein
MSFTLMRATVKSPCQLHVRHVQHRGIEDSVRPQHSPVRQGIARVRGFDRKHRERLARLHAPQSAARQQDVVARGEAQMAEITVQLARSLMDEEEIVAVGVAHQVIHAPGRALPEAHAHGRIRHDFRGLPGLESALCGGAGEIERVRAQRTFECHPSRRRMAVIEVRGGPEETFLADLAFERAGRQIRMRLPRGFAFHV